MNANPISADKSSNVDIEIFRELFNSIDQGFCILQMQYDQSGNPENLLFLRTNQVFEQQAGLEDCTGKLALDVMPNLEPSWLALYNEVLVTNVPKRFENYVADTDRWFDVFASRIADERNDKIMVVFSDITQRKKKEAHNLALHRISDEMSRHATAKALMESVCAILGDHLKLTACQFMHIDEKSDCVFARDTWQAAGIVALPETLKLSEQVNEGFLEKMRKGEIAVSNDTRNNPITKGEANAKIQAMAFVAVPFLEQGEWKYVFSVHDAKPRIWREDEIALIEEVAMRIFPRLERARAEEMLRQSEQVYRKQLEQEVGKQTAALKERNKTLLEAQRLGRVGDFYFDFENDSVHWSDELYRIMGFEKGEALDFESAISVYVPEDRKRLAELTSESLKTGKTFELEAEFIPNGQTEKRCLFLKAEAVQKDGKGIGVKGVVQDITESHQLKEKLRQHTLELERQNKMLNDAQALGKIGDFMYDMRTGKVIWSDEMYRIRGFRIGEELSYDKVLANYSENVRDKFIDYPRNSLETGIGFEFEVEFQPLHSEEWRWLFMKGEPFYGENGEKIGTKGIAQDITQRKQAEHRIRELNDELRLKNRELESLNSELATFNNIAANDYSQTLRTLYTNLEYVLKNDAANFSNTGKANMRKAQMAIQKLKLLTEDIVAFSRIPAMDSRAEDIDLNAILKSVIEDMTSKIEEAGLEIELDRLPSISGFPMLLSILFHHLLDNAAKFRSKEPKLSIYSEVALIDGKEYCKIGFCDDGIGFPPHESDNIFSIFYRLHDRQKYRGSGVGLAVCKKIMDLHGGFISAESDGGKGAKFCCYFPI